MFFEDVRSFLDNLTFWQVLYYFWPFFLIDFFRYVLLEIVLVPRFLWRRRGRRERARRQTARARLFTERPLVSVIAPGKNEGAHLPRLLDSLARQTYRTVETIVVDDGSDDETPAICRRYQRAGRLSLFIRNEVRGGKASAANTALKYARGSFVVHVDADSWLAPDALEKILIPFYLDPEVGAVGGDIRVNNVDATFATRLQTIEYMKSLSTGRTVSTMLGILRIIAGAYGAFRRDALERVGGWDVGPGLDGDLTVKIRKLGLKVVHEPTAACYTHVPDSFRKLARQRYRWDRSMVRFRMRKHRDVLLPSASFRLRNFLSSAENIFFNFLLNLKWWVYIFQIMIFHPTQLPVIVFINYVLYTLANVIEVAVAMALFGRSLRPVEARMFLFVPLVPLYTGFYLRVVRTFAYLMELIHGASYLDRWNPWKVSRVARRERL